MQSNLPFNYLADHIVEASQIIDKKLLARLIEDQEELYRFVSTSQNFEVLEWKMRIGDVLRELRKLNQKLGYE